MTWLHVCADGTPTVHVFTYITPRVLEKQVLTVKKAVEDDTDEWIAVLDRLGLDDIEALRERRLQQMKKMADKRSCWISLRHVDYSEIPCEKEFFTAVKASERIGCHFYGDNWPCKVVDKHLSALANQHIETFCENSC
ncbi:hypothetical protein RJ641_003195 [Dillenia turbinata]|uniref:Uncharacterized protein n=1 Tax=Dillenia turbinata TaxID=194707 RepID=A0AAN8VL14_9MAGN